MYDEILLQVQKPARYIGKEWNCPDKDFEKSNIKFALCFPDLYEVAMSNLGIRIIYDILNNIQDVCCERIFSPGLDMEGTLRQKKLEILSLESKKKLIEFDIIGFSLAYELCYTNVLNILSLGNIPYQASLRDSRFPLVIGGGPCVLNPEPVADFFDLFIFGEAEEVIDEIIDCFRRLKDRYKKSQITKEDLLIELAKIAGVYVPSLYEVKYSASQDIESFKPKGSASAKIKKRFVKDLDQSAYPLEWLVPYIQIIHDRVVIEVSRGCPNKCRFCQARNQYFPLRQRSADKVMELAGEIYSRTGYEEISLGGLSVSDHSEIEKLLGNLVSSFKQKGISISLPSVKPNLLLGELSCLIATIKKTSLTFAPEAGSDKLRKTLGKDFNEEEFFKIIERVYSLGYQHVKLYFMIGLPGEEKQDLDAILDFSQKVSEIRRKINKGPAQVNVSVNTLIPKPHTCFQWMPMIGLDTIREKQEYLKKKLKSRSIKLNFAGARMSLLEGILSRGDRRMSAVILEAFKNGARFDSWDNHFNFDYWQSAFLGCAIDPEYYLKARKTDDNLPWDFLDVGVEKKSLIL